MRKSIKILLLISLSIILILGLWFLYRLYFNQGWQEGIKSLFLKDSPKAPARIIEVDDPSLMTLDERLQFKLSPSVKVEVWQRNASGTVMVYKKISEEDYQAKLAEIENNKKYDIDGQGEKVEILNDEDKYKLGLFHLGVYKVVSRNENGGISAYSYLRTDNEKEIPLEWLSEEEKDSLGIDPSIRVQLLKRGESGKILAYKIIKDEADILDRY